MITLLERYTQHLSSLRASAANSGAGSHKASDDIYDMPADIQLPEQLGEFANVYQVHCPKINLNNATRDVIHFPSFGCVLLKHSFAQILQQYYLASRARRGAYPMRQINYTVNIAT